MINDSKPLLILSANGLVPGSLGCFGSSWNATPAIDRIAGSGCVWDRLVGRSDDPHENLREVFGGGNWMSVWKQRGRVECLTDDPPVAAMADDFDRVECIESSAAGRDSPAADEIESTRFGELVATLLDGVAEDPPALMWVHTRCLTHAWDAPRELIAFEREGDGELDRWEPSPLSFSVDPATESNEELDESVPPWMDSAWPPRVVLGQDYHPDLVMAWTRTYACQIRLMDVMIDVIGATWHGVLPRIMIWGTSGFHLGEHGHIGHRFGPARSADFHLPLIIGGVGPLRLPQVRDSTLIAQWLTVLGEGRDDFVAPSVWCDDSNSHRVASQCDRAKRVITTQPWFYVEDREGDESLYSKPDDRHDVNDVARLRPDVLETLRDSSSVN